MSVKDSHVTLSFRVRRTRLPAIQKIALALGYRKKDGLGNPTAWIAAMFQKEFDEQVSKLAERTNEQTKYELSIKK